MVLFLLTHKIYVSVYKLEYSVCKHYAQHALIYRYDSISHKVMTVFGLMCDMLMCAAAVGSVKHTLP